jgi:hypothetical protein
MAIVLARFVFTGPVIRGKEYKIVAARGNNWEIRPMRSSVSSAILLAVMCLACVAQNRAAGDESARVLSLENMWNQAEVEHDARAMNMLLAETFKYTDDDGSFMNKAQWLAHVNEGADRYNQLGNSGMSVDLYGDAAIVTGEYREKIKARGKIVVHSGRFTDTWIYLNSRWMCVTSQATLISH